MFWSCIMHSVRLVRHLSVVYSVSVDRDVDQYRAVVMCDVLLDASCRQSSRNELFDRCWMCQRRRSIQRSLQHRRPILHKASRSQCDTTVNYRQSTVSQERLDVHSKYATGYSQWVPLKIGDSVPLFSILEIT